MPDRPVSAQFAAWGGLSVVAVTRPEALEAAVGVVRRLVDAVDLACSSFRGDSELARLNAAAGAPVQVSELLIEYLRAGLRAAELTGGDVDPTVGEALVALGFIGSGRDHRADGHGDRAPSPEDPATRHAAHARRDGDRALRFELCAVPGYRAIELDDGAGTVRLARGVRLDLGATAKALAADQAAAAVCRETGTGVLVSLSGDLSIAGPPPRGGWRVRVTDDHRSDERAPGQSISLRSGGLATSSTAVRVHTRGRQRLHHVIDPATGVPAATRLRTVSVAAASCLDANIASTAALVRGERAVGWLEDLRLPSRLVGLDGTVRHVAGWPSEDEDLPVATLAQPAAATKATA